MNETEKRMKDISKEYKEKMKGVRRRNEGTGKIKLKIKKRYFLESSFMVGRICSGATMKWLRDFNNPYMVAIRDKMEEGERNIEKLNRYGEQAVWEVEDDNESSGNPFPVTQGWVDEIIVTHYDESGEFLWASAPVLGIVYNHSQNSGPWIIMGHSGGNADDRMKAIWICSPKGSHVHKQQTSE
ncbi:MAG: hypothetical protein U9Q16_00340 [Patescibacteria group bacterium]|nr:hypothetical protein [Patescibacteria group bacterium]